MRQLFRRVWNAIRRGQFETDLSDEIEFHRHMRQREFEASGHTPMDAAAAARRALGSIALAQDRARDVWVWRLLDDSIGDVRHSARTLRRNPGFATIAVLTLALGVGANAAIFSVIRAVLLTPVPFADADRVVVLGEESPILPGQSTAVSAPNYADWVQEATVFERIAAATGGNATLSGTTSDPVFVEGLLVSSSYFDVFGLHAALGRTFAPGDDQPSKTNVVVVSNRLWTSQFAEDRAIVGKTVRLDRDVYTIIGVMPPRAEGLLFEADVWRPRDFRREGGGLTKSGQVARDVRDIGLVVAKIRRDVSLDSVRTEMRTIGDRLAGAYPASNQGWSVIVRSWPHPITPDFQRSLFVLLAAVGTVLFICCVNLANLALARGAASARDIAVRTALGAGRGRLVRQLLTEHGLIAVGGGVCGVLIGYGLLEILPAWLPAAGTFKVVRSDLHVPVDLPLWSFAMALSGLSGIVSGLAPALAATSVPLTRVIKDGSSTAVSATRSHQRFRSSLVAAEVALAFVLLITASLFVQSFVALQRRAGTGFDGSGVLTARLPIPPSHFQNPAILNGYLDRIADRLRALPGVRNVAFTEGLPTEGTPFGWDFQRTDQSLVVRAQRSSCGFKVVSPSYFSTVRLRVLKGRALNEQDRAGAPLVVVINETFARLYFPDLDPIGRRLLAEPRVGGATDLTWEIAGVVADESVSPWTRMPEAMVYGTREQTPSDYLELAVRGQRDQLDLLASVRQAILSVDRDQAVTNMRSLNQLTEQSVAPDRLRFVLLRIFAVTAAALAAIGLYGVMAYAVVQRTRELGIRRALGANQASAMALVVRQGMTMTGIGLAAGLAGAVLTTRLLTTVVSDITPADWTTMAAVTSLIGAIALLACAIPAYRATRVDPMTALRLE